MSKWHECTVYICTKPNDWIKRSDESKQLNMYKRKFEKFDLVILDESGYVSFDKLGCKILFNILSNRNDKGD